MTTKRMTKLVVGQAQRLGTVKLGVRCLYVTRLDAVDALVLDELIRLAWNRPDHVEG